MGTVYKETFTKPLPAGAKIIVRKGQRLAEWKDAKGKTRTAPLTAGRGPDHRGSRHLHRQVSGRLGDRPQGGDRLPGRNGRPVGACGLGTAGRNGEGRRC